MTTPSIEDQSRALMSAWVEQQGPSEEVRSRAWEAICARASAGELGPELEPELPTPTPKLGSLRLILGSLGALGIAAVIVGVGVRLSERDARPHADQAAARPVEPVGEPAPPEPPPPIPAPAPAAAPATASSEPAPVPVPAAKPRRPAASPTKPVDGEREDQVDPLALEMQLLGAARTALKAGDVEAALAALDKHAERFPKGALRAERELSRITALCKAGRLDDAEVTARRYIDAHPNSTQAKRLADTCIGDRL